MESQRTEAFLVPHKTAKLNKSMFMANPFSAVYDIVLKRLINISFKNALETSCACSFLSFNVKLIGNTIQIGHIN